MVRRKVDSGEYLDESEVVVVALEGLDNDIAPMRGPQIEQWLRNEVVPTYDAVEADALRVFTVDEVKASLAAMHEQTSKARNGS